jgi:hypothetical protein
LSKSTVLTAAVMPEMLSTPDGKAGLFFSNRQPDMWSAKSSAV